MGNKAEQFFKLYALLMINLEIPLYISEFKSNDFTRIYHYTSIVELEK